MRTYPVQTDSHRGPTLLFKPKCMKPYYTKPVIPIEKWGHTQCRGASTEALTCQSIPSVQSPTTPNQYNLLTNMDIPSADRPPKRGPTLLIKPKCMEPYYTKPVLPIEK